MHRIVIVAALAAVVAGPAFAAEGCSTAPASKFQSKATLEANLKAEGMKVRQIKTEKGCYEVYAIGKDGKKVNAAFNAETLQKLADAEAGEK
jgi:hypothetical protein